MGKILFIKLLLALSAVSVKPDGAGQDGLIRQDPGCGDCHSDLVEYERMHFPAEDACENCHESTGASHPSDSTGFRLVDGIPELCYYCHEEPLVQNVRHDPHSRGECLACHNPHGSTGSSLLHLADPDLCLGCHRRDFRSDSTETRNIRSLLSGKNRVHTAIEMGGCLGCHRAHGSEFRVLLLDRYPEEDYLPARTENFALCFLCHDTDLMDAIETEWATGFRDGSRNLHRVHVNGEKGRNCRMCHNMHGSPQPFLVEENVGFGKWEMRLNFIAVEQGGSCLPGCHGKLSYER